MKRTVLAFLLLLTTACGGNDNNPSDSDVAGNWVGTYQTTRCTDTTALALCGFIPGGGFSLTLVQTGNSVSGSMQYGNVVGNVTGTTTNGNITLNPWTFNTTLASGAPAAFQHSAQTFKRSGNDLTGTYRVVVTVTGSTGGLDADAMLIGVVKT